MSTDCIFCNIVHKEIPTNFITETNDLMVFKDIHPSAPIHLLIVPKIHMDDFLMMEDKELMMKLVKIIQNMIEKFGLSKKGYRLEVNGGGFQIVSHLHFHILGPISKGGVL